MNEIMRRALADAMRPLVELVYKVEAKLAGKPHFEWGTVTSINPLRVKLDSHSTALPDRPDSLVTGLAVGDRVRVERQGTRATIHGAGGKPSGQPYSMAAGSITISPPSGGGSNSATVTFPVGRFTTSPSVSVTPQTGAGNTVTLNVWVENITATSATVGMARSNATTTTLRWLAVQMTKESGAG